MLVKSYYTSEIDVGKLIRTLDENYKQAMWISPPRTKSRAAEVSKSSSKSPSIERNRDISKKSSKPLGRDAAKFKKEKKYSRLYSSSSSDASSPSLSKQKSKRMGPPPKVVDLDKTVEWSSVKLEEVNKNIYEEDPNVKNMSAAEVGCCIVFFPKPNRQKGGYT